MSNTDDNSCDDNDFLLCSMAITEVDDEDLAKMPYTDFYRPDIALKTSLTAVDRECMMIMSLTAHLMRHKITKIMNCGKPMLPDKKPKDVFHFLFSPRVKTELFRICKKGLQNREEAVVTLS